MKIMPACSLENFLVNDMIIIYIFYKYSVQSVICCTYKL